MNKRIVFNTLGKILIIEAFLMVFPLIVSIIYKDNNYGAFLLPMGVMLVIGSLLIFLIKPKRRGISSKEGFIIVGLSWILMSLFGALPYVISAEIPNFVDALFETVSGFTTTGATVLYSDDFPNISKSIMFFRSFTHFIGGMGVLVFVLAILPQSDGKNIFILKAESSGPQVGKLVSKIKITARILYIMYVALTAIEIILLVVSPSMNLYEAITYSFSTAGTGGFGLYSDSCASFSPYCQVVIGIFMAIFGINFNIFYLIIIGKVSKALKSEELWVYISVIVLSSIVISSVNFFGTDIYSGFGESLRNSFFQAVSFQTSTGFSTANYMAWPSIARTLLLILMYVGACAGSTGGGLKVSRIVILFKSAKASLKRIVHPRSIQSIRFEGTTLDEETEKGVLSYFALIMLVVFASTLILSIDGFDLETNFSAVTSCINNVGLAFGKIGIEGTFGFYSTIPKLLMILLMLMGRLEVYPIIILFSLKAWKNK